MVALASFIALDSCILRTAMVVWGSIDSSSKWSYIIPEGAPSSKDMEAEPMCKVIMLGDDEYEVDPVCEVLQTVIPDIENFKQAKEKYDECDSTGKAMLLVVPKEHAEAYVEQLIRAEPMVYAEIEEE